MAHATRTTTTPPKGERILGAFCWNELHTRDVGRTAAFYRKVIGWTTHECPGMPDGGAYVEWVRSDGAHVGGLMGMPAQVPAERPAHWAVYVSAADVDAVVAKATSLGGRTIAPAFDVPEVGRIAAIADPSGAVIHLLQGVGECGARALQSTPGSFCWMELLTSDPEACTRFCGDLLGWQPEVMKMPGTDYTLFWLGDADRSKKQGCVGGMMRIRPEWGPLPSVWLSYIMVEDVDAAAQRATAEGGTVVTPPQDIPNIGRFAVARDPTGATFALFTSVSAS